MLRKPDHLQHQCRRRAAPMHSVAAAAAAAATFTVYQSYNQQSVEALLSCSGAAGRKLRPARIDSPASQPPLCCSSTSSRKRTRGNVEAAVVQPQTAPSLDVALQRSAPWGVQAEFRGWLRQTTDTRGCWSLSRLRILEALNFNGWCKHAVVLVCTVPRGSTSRPPVYRAWHSLMPTKS